LFNAYVIKIKIKKITQHFKTFIYVHLFKHGEVSFANISSDNYNIMILIVIDCICIAEIHITV